jgi:hypothetical protein
MLLSGNVPSAKLDAAERALLLVSDDAEAFASCEVHYGLRAGFG